MTSRYASELQRFVMFAAVGSISTALDMALFFFLVTGLSVTPVLANTLSFCIGTLNGFFWNKYWTFRERRGEGTDAYRLPLFFMLYLVGLGISNTLIWALGSAVPIMLAKVVATAGSMIWNYLSIRRLVYGSRASPGRSTRRAGSRQAAGTREPHLSPTGPS